MRAVLAAATLLLAGCLGAPQAPPQDAPEASPEIEVTPDRPDPTFGMRCPQSGRVSTGPTATER